MKAGVRQQLVVSGVGGQGVLFITRLLAEAAMLQGLPVFTSETHGMAQRGGTVISHLKVGDFASPMIRPGCADGLIILKAENLALHAGYARKHAWAVVNQGRFEARPQIQGIELQMHWLDGTGLAARVASARSANLVVLGRALEIAGGLFCGHRDVARVLKQRLGADSETCRQALAALDVGQQAAR